MKTWTSAPRWIRLRRGLPRPRWRRSAGALALLTLAGVLTGEGARAQTNEPSDALQAPPNRDEGSTPLDETSPDEDEGTSTPAERDGPADAPDPTGGGNDGDSAGGAIEHAGPPEDISAQAETAEVAESAQGAEEDEDDEDEDEPAWWDLPARFFTGGAVDVGWLYFRPRFSAGYGKPHELWLGIDVNPIFGGSGVGTYGGIRAFHPNIDLRVGARYFFAFRRSFLDPAEEFDHITVQSRAGPPSRYLSLEAELTYAIPVGFGAIIGELAGTAILLVPDDLWVFEETIRIVAVPPWVWRVKAGYAIRFGPDDAITFALVAELVGIPNRDGALIFRAGGQGSVRVFRDLSIRFRFIPPLLSPDNLGAGGGDSFQLGLRYIFATD